MFDQVVKTLSDVIRRAEWSDLTELLLIGSAVYAVMRFFRGTRGARLLRGFALLLVGGTLLMYLLANLLDLARILVIFPTFITALFLIALVAFQPELRRALMRLGAQTWFVESPEEIDRIIEQVVEAVTYLAKNKIGALIAFERASEFGMLSEDAIKLDAEVTSQLIMTIFWPGSALHDMGVIISRGRVAAAGVQFPLTDSQEVSPELGSRHRAAIGLSEESDALVVVVSEETGIISVIEDGKIRRNLMPENLRQALREGLGGQAQK
ncbi:MAG: diadenylate cyclase CdaA [Phycisphaerae bacterium]|nr:diadenylate cyclase CdaA [Phycisphaerae bacterium]